MAESSEIDFTPELEGPNLDRAEGFRIGLDIFSILGTGHIEPLISRKIADGSLGMSDEEIYRALISRPEEYGVIIIRNLKHFESFMTPEDEETLLKYAQRFPYDNEVLVGKVCAAIVRIRREREAITPPSTPLSDPPV